MNFITLENIMRYRIANKSNRYLYAFHFNGGWSMKDVFPCSINSWICFNSEEEAKEYLKRMENSCHEQKERWGEWYDKAISYVKKFKIVT